MKAIELILSKSPEHILIIEDEENIQELIQYNLEQQGYSVNCAFNGKEAEAHLQKTPPDLILLDRMLPGKSGIELCKQFKQTPSIAHIPIILVTAKGEEEDVVVGLEAGADDYILKPFSPPILIARVKAVLRRVSLVSIKSLPQSTQNSNSSTSPTSDEIHFKEIQIHFGRREVSLKGISINLTFSEFEVLALLIKKPGWVFTRNQIVEGIRGGEYPVTERSVDVLIVSLRKKLGELSPLLETIRGVGYRLKDER